MYRIGMIGLGTVRMPIAWNFIVRGFEIIGHWRDGSPALAVGCSLHDRICGVSAVPREECS